MSALAGHAVGHLVRRGVHAKVTFSQVDKPGQDDELTSQQFLPVYITVILLILLSASIRYTIGEVVASLAMIESRTTTAIIEDKPPAYNDEPDAPLEKDAVVSETEVDVEVTLINHKPITSKITQTVGHITRIGGFFARWRGFMPSFVYHAVHSGMAGFIAHVFNIGFIGQAVVYIFTSVCLARLHMVWTHAMITHPSKKPFFRRMVARKQCKALLLPSLVYATAQQATMILPIGVAIALGLSPRGMSRGDDLVEEFVHNHCRMVVSIGLRVLAVLATAALVGFAVLLPASVTLTRIEASLLPEGEETIVPFDRDAVVGDIDVNVRGGCRALFVQAWRSFDRSARWRLVKLYLKLALIQFTVFIVGVHLVALELYVCGGEKLVLFIKKGMAELRRLAREAHDHSHNQ